MLILIFIVLALAGLYMYGIYGFIAALLVTAVLSYAIR